jgi:hypothetical protein
MLDFIRAWAMACAWTCICAAQTGVAATAVSSNAASIALREGVSAGLAASEGICCMGRSRGPVGSFTPTE